MNYLPISEFQTGGVSRKVWVANPKAGKVVLGAFSRPGVFVEAESGRVTAFTVTHFAVPVPPDFDPLVAKPRQRSSKPK